MIHELIKIFQQIRDLCAGEKTKYWY